MKYYMTQNGFRTDLSHQTLDIAGNEDYGIRPYQLMVSSIAGCSSLVLKKILEKQRMHIDDIEVTADVHRVPEEANRIDRIALHFTIKGQHIDPDKMERNMELTRENCSMVQTIKDCIEITETFDIVELSR